MDNLWLRKANYFGLVVGGYLSYRMTNNQNELEKHSQQK
jgi:hypothetical protein